MKLNDLDPLARAVLEQYAKEKYCRLTENKVIKNPIPLRQEKNMQSVDWIRFYFTNQIQIQFALRFTLKCQKYLNYSTIYQLFLQSKKVAERNDKIANQQITPVSDPDQDALNIGKGGETGGEILAGNVGLNCKPICDFALPETPGVKFTGETRIHRVVFHSKRHGGAIVETSDLFQKIKSQIIDFKDKLPTNFLKLDSFTLGISKGGVLQFYVKCELNKATDSFIREFSFLNQEEMTLFLQSLDPKPVIEVAAPYVAETDILKHAKVQVTFPGSKPGEKKVLWLWEDGSETMREIDVRGEGQTSYNLATLIADRLGAIQFFEDVKKELKKIQNLSRFMIKLYLESDSGEIKEIIQDGQDGQDGQMDNGQQNETE